MEASAVGMDTDCISVHEGCMAVLSAGQMLLLCSDSGCPVTLISHLFLFSPVLCYFPFLFLHCEAFVGLFKETIREERVVCCRLPGPEK